MDINQTLKDCENSLRDFIAYTLEKEYGEGWINKLKVSPERVAEWEQCGAPNCLQGSATVGLRELVTYADLVVSDPEDPANNPQVRISV